MLAAQEGLCSTELDFFVSSIENFHFDSQWRVETGCILSLDAEENISTQLWSSNMMMIATGSLTEYRTRDLQITERER
jgi:hypothetical protein